VTGECSREAGQHRQRSFHIGAKAVWSAFRPTGHKGSPLRDGRLDGALVQVVHRLEGAKANFHWHAFRSPECSDV
jgi:hypothetical protein